MFGRFIPVIAIVSKVLAGTMQYPEVIPGAGLPSLKELGLTTAQLYNMGPPKQADVPTLSASFTGVCGPENAAYTNVNALVACFHYLNNLNTQQCRAPANRKSVEFCRSGDARVTGVSITGDSASSYCRDAASGLLWVIDHCTRPDQSCAGAQAAAGNGNLIVSGASHNWGSSSRSLI